MCGFAANITLMYKKKIETKKKIYKKKLIKKLIDFLRKITKEIEFNEIFLNKIKVKVISPPTKNLVVKDLLFKIVV